ncbi:MULTISPECIES: lipoprotein-releasing ABC transporter permease subunit [Acidithiobacillus]|jgi:lipoprotein-releasing system permease protein|uniref:lipoprotein-releasing ABC transporter permease subunit n=2 Tax=Acidithiobacillaceae TaxID=225058 RepID=UPI002308614E|nr:MULTISPECIES: lipoprotein-releasing ABC transporter permease subunit [Acidithiobacillus]MDA8246167.1 lipoprotein-releasing ABC transporter permease subunit [Acidithiobacillus sp.]MEB8536473.1 lipoprotein-releasing ABC transporter permease subunit [Acidithiobacillus ferriphilus]WCE94535.1 lipoprotein-releasing ABC transporter permease subunit [Acidithiobacillus ferriphilus]
MRFYELWIGLRYTRAKRRNHFISFITGTAIMGMVIGVAALIAVMAVMNGFDHTLRARILAVTSDVIIQGNGVPVLDWPTAVKRLSTIPDVTGMAPYVQAQAMLSHDGLVSGAVIEGIDPSLESRVNKLASDMKMGDLQSLRTHPWGIVLGRALARQLGVTVGDKITLISPQGGVTPLGVTPALRQFTVVGLFSVGIYAYDSGMAYISLGDAQRLYGLNQGVTGLRMQIKDPFAAPAFAARLQQQLGAAFYIQDWTQTHENFFKALSMEKLVMFVILSLIIAVAAFNIVATLVMVVTDKETDIAILRTIGATPHSIMLIFMVQGGIIGLFGTLLGVFFGVLLALNIPTLVPAIEQLFHVQFISPEVYSISQLPSKLEPWDVIHVAIAALIMSWIATLYPSWRASRIAPAEALRYE